MQKTIQHQKTVAHDDQNIDRDAYKKEFDFGQIGETESADQGQPNGYLRFVAFKKSESESAMISDCQLSDEFVSSIVQLFSENNVIFDRMKLWVEAAKSVRSGMPLPLAVIGVRLGAFDSGKTSHSGDEIDVLDLFAAVIKKLKSSDQLKNN